MTSGGLIVLAALLVAPALSRGCLLGHRAADALHSFRRRP
jgi:hypothetical protein